MLQIVPHMRILVARDPLDFRRGFDGTIATCRQVLAEDPFDGTVFVFRARSGKMVRILVYDGQGFWLMTKRLSEGRFRFWCEKSEGDATMMLEPHALVSLLAGGDWTRVRVAPTWRAITAPRDAPRST